MPPGCPDAADAAGCGPPSNRLRVHSEERGHLPGSEKALIVPIHVLPLLISVSEHVFSVAKTSVYFLVFPKNEPLVSLVSFGLSRAGRSAGPAGQACSLISPAVHGKWRDVPVGAAVVAQCAVRDYRMCKALLSPAVIIGSSPIAERVPGIWFAAIQVSGVADDAGAMERLNRLASVIKVPPAAVWWLRVGWMADSRRRRRRSSREPCRGDR